MNARVLKLGFTALSSALVLSACGGGDGDGGTPASSEEPAALETTISILAPSYADSSKSDWEKTIAEFNKTYPKVEVKLQIEGCSPTWCPPASRRMTTLTS